MDKAHILHEIQRLASEHGKPPGRDVFERATGIRQTEWYPHLWLRWGDALNDAGLTANVLQGKLPDQLVLQRYVELARELGKIPVTGELRRKAQNDSSFPSHTVFARFGGKQKLIGAAKAFCQSHADYQDVFLLFEGEPTETTLPELGRTRLVTGFVYLMKSGRHYKIGRTNALGRRQWELGIKIPIPPKTIHAIETDDPVGVESYWHKRFADKRGEGEWFELSPEDVQAFKRWKQLV